MMRINVERNIFFDNRANNDAAEKKLATHVRSFNGQ